MADPSPVVGLPDAEFVELYNASETSINLHGFTLNDEALPDFILPAGSFAIVIDDANISLFSAYEDLVVLSAFDALTNGGKAVVLKDQFSNTIDSMFYQMDWYGNGEKDDGGYTLELIDPLQPCSGGDNWKASLDITGGTPGRQNSVVLTEPDQAAPTLIRLEVTGGDTIFWFFSEPVDESSLSPAAFSLEGYEISHLEMVSFSSGFMVLSNPLESETEYTLTVGAIQDCFGNSLVSQSMTFYYDVSAPVLQRLIVLSSNEVALIFHEELNKPTAEEESNYLLEDFTTDQALLQDTAANRVHLLFEEPFEVGAVYQLSVGEIEDTLKNPASTSLISFEFRAGIDTIISIAGNLLEIHFAEAPSQPEALDFRKYYVPGKKSHPIEVLPNSSDDRIFRLPFLTAFEQNKEHLLYVEGLRAADGSAMITPADAFSIDTRAPVLEASIVKNDSQVILSFNEDLNLPQSTLSSLYRLEGENPLGVISISASELELTFMRKFEQEKTVTLSYTGVTDLTGNAITTNRNVSFTYDTKPPEVERAQLMNDTLISLSLSEMLIWASAMNPSNFVIGSSNPVQIRVMGPDSVRLELVFTGLPYAEVAEVSVYNLTDQRGNVLTEQLVRFNSLNPAIINLIPETDSTIQVKFNKPMAQSTEDLSAYELTGFDPEKVTRLTASSVLLEVDHPFQDGDSLSLTVSDLESESGLPLLDQSASTVFRTWIESVSIVDPGTLLLDFATVLPPTSASSFHVTGNTVVLALADGADQTMLLLSLQDDLPENSVVRLNGVDLFDVYGRVIPDFSYPLVLDTNAPEIRQVTSDYFSVLMVTFTEPIDENVASSANRFELSGFGNPASAMQSTDSVVTLDFQDQLTAGQTYSLLITGLADEAGNYSSSDTIVFTYEPPAVPLSGEIIINEIMADPAPVIGLPETEYVELYNKSSHHYNLKGLILTDASATVFLPDFVLGSHEFIVITPQVHGLSFPGIQHLMLQDFPSLTNNGERLTLNTRFGDLVDEVNYSAAWYGDSEKDDGGFSLERIDPYTVCPEAVNWSASVHESGGTPGTINSIFRTGPDNHLPEIIQLVIVSSQEIRLTFSEPMDEASLMNATLGGTLNVGSREVLGEYTTELHLFLEPALAVGFDYLLTVQGAMDCTGSVLEPVSFHTGIGKIPEPGELIFTEIMADPEPTVGLPNSEYIEVYNNSGSRISLEGVALTDDMDTTFLPAVNVPQDTYILLCPSGNSTLFVSYGEVVGLTRWLSLNNTGEKLTLLAKEMIIDDVQYSRDWYHLADQADGGYSLEMINPFSECPGNVNWDGSKDERGGSPGMQNSIHNLNPDTDQPSVISLEVMDERSVRLTFSEAMDSLSLLTAGVETDLLPAHLISGAENKVLDVTFSRSIPKGSLVELEITGAKDCSGNRMEPALLVFGIGDRPSFNELLITEIMADPEPSVGLPVSEYIEVYNASERLLSLKDIVLTDEIGQTVLPAVTLGAGAFFLLAPTSTVAQFSIENKAGVANWTTLSNSGERLALTLDGQLIHQVFYAQEWHTLKEEPDGGVSLEMKDLYNPCAGRLNWGSSRHVLGGTPGYPNSNMESIPDHFGPNLLDVWPLSKDSLLLLFDEPLSDAARTTVAIDPPVEVAALIVDDLRSTELYIKLANSLEENRMYRLELSAVYDCNGNEIRQNAQDFVLPSHADSLDLLISEVLFDPRTEGADFVEIYNRSTSYIDLNGWAIARITADGTEQEAMAEGPLIIGPGEYLALTEDTLTVKTQYPKGAGKRLMQVTALPSLPNEEGNVALLDPHQKRMDQFSYSADYHLSLLKSVDGVSLERISFLDATQDPNNWRSAASSSGFATPGYANSQAFEAPQTTAVLQIEPRVFVPGSVNPAGMQSFTTINYQFNRGGQFANIVVYNQLGQPVAELARGASLSTSGFIRWDGTSTSGTTVRSGYYVVVFEVYDGNGNREVMKETVVVGRL